MPGLQLCVVAIAPSVGALSALWIWPGATGGIIYAACKAVLYGIPLVVLVRMVSVRGLGAWLVRGTGTGGVAWGIGSGLLIGGLVLAAWTWWLGPGADTSRLVAVLEENGMSGPLRFWAFAAWLCLGNSLLEELVFRWYVDSRLEELGAGPGLVLVGSAGIFTLHHVIVLAAYVDWRLVLIGSLGVFVGGVTWSITRRRWRTILPGWISHGLVDLAIIVIGIELLRIPT